jgi:hypothetical protein
MTDTLSLQEQIDILSAEMYGALPTIVTPPPSPIDALPQQRKLQLQQFQQHITSNPEGWYSKLTLTKYKDIQELMNNPLTYYRYLKGYEWKPELAETKLKAMVEWRIKERPSELTMEQLKIIGETRLVQCYGFDRQYRPIVYVNMGQIDKDKNWDSDEKLMLKFKYFVYMTEVAVERMSQVHPHVFQQVWIIDMNDSNIGLGHVKKVKDLFLGLGDYHPERLHSALICNGGWTLNILFNFIKYFLTEEMIAKYKFVKKGYDEELAKTLHAVMDRNKYLLSNLKGPVKNPHDIHKIIQLEKLKKELSLSQENA